MAPDGSVIIDTKMDTSGLPSQLNKLKKMLGGAVAAFAVPAAVTKAIKIIGDLNKIYMVQASAERALSQAAANNPYLTGESVNNLKRYASELQKVSNYGDEVTIGLMTQLAAAGRTESEIQSIIKASADLAASGTTTFDGAVKNLNKTYSGLSGELGEVIPELKTLTAEQMKNGEAVDLIAKKYDGMALSVVDKSVQIQNALGDLKEGIGEIGASTGLTSIFQNSLLAITEWYTSGIRMFNDWVSRMRGTKDYEVDVLKQTLEERKNIVAKEKEIIKELYKEMEKDQDPTTLDYLDAEISKKWKLVSELEDGISMLYAEIETKEKAIASTATKTSEEITEAEKKQIEGRIAAQEQYETAVTLATEKQKGGIITLEEKWEDIKKAAETYTDALITLGYTYDEIGTKGGQALDEMRRKLTGVDLSLGLGGNISGVKLPMGMFDTFVNNAADLGDDWGKQLTGSMASSLDNTSVGVSDAMGGIVSNIAAAITTTVAIVKKIFAGIKAVAKFDPMAMYESFTEIITGLTKFFAKVGSLPSLVESGKKVLDEFIRGMIENRETHKETFSNVVKYLLETARDELPFVIEFAFIMMKDISTAIIEQLPLLIDTAFAIIGALATGVLDSLPAIITAAGKILPALIYSILVGWPMLYLTIIEHLPEIFTAIIEATIAMLPELTMALIQAWIQTSFIMPALIIAALVGVIVGVVAQLVKDIYTLFTPAGYAIWEGIGQGIKDGWARFAEDVRKAFKSIGDMFKDMFGIHSPSTVFAGFGAMIMEGLKNGITGANIWDGIKSTFTNIIDNIKALFSAGTWAGIGDSIINGITTGVSSASSAISNIGSGISNVVSNIGAGISSVASTVGGWINGLFNADGTNNFRGGKAIINEKGAEMVTIPSGSKIMTASATAQMQDRAISQLLSGMKMPSFATAGSGGNKSITIENKINAPIMVEGSVFGRLVYETIDKAVV